MNVYSPAFAAGLHFSQACENNQAPIFEVLQTVFNDRQHVLEIGSGTGQHSVFFAPRLPQLVWQTSDLLASHESIAAWHQAHGAANLRAPVEFDVASSNWPQPADAVPFDAAFTSNTCHIVAWPLVERMFCLVGQHLPKGGVFAIYGPFNYGGQFTSDSNRAFDASLRARDAKMGIRDFESIDALARGIGLRLEEDVAMPANNRCLVWRRAG